MKKITASFSEWYFDFKEHVRNFKYYGPIDQETCQDEYEQGNDSEKYAKEFVKEMNE